MTEDVRDCKTATEPAAPSAGPPGFRPTLCLGLGGAATHVLRRLRRRLTHRFGEPARLPSLRMLALDTDLAALRATALGEQGDLLHLDESLHLPLRKPADYRSATDEILSWLSRRWLYNIPRSLHTEGLRPLGRLAFIDHRLAISQRIGAAMAEAVAAKSLERSSQTLGLAVRSASPRVFVVTSIGGGSGGGMLLDVAYAVRQQLDELGLPADGLCGVMLHATFARSPVNDLRKANAYATLTELNHFMQGGAAYRAGPLEVLPAGDVSEPPFADAYLVDLGRELNEGGFNSALDQVAQYLYLNAATACGAALDECRQAGRGAPISGHPGSGIRENSGQADHPRPGAGLRSFGLHSFQFDKYGVAAREADRLGLRLVRAWLGDDQDGQSYTDRIQAPGFQLADLVTRLQSIADGALSGNAEVYFRTLVAAGPGRPPIVGDDDPAGPYGDELRRIHAVFGLPSMLEAAQDSALPRFESTLRDASRQLAAGMAAELVESVSALVEQPPARLPIAAAAASLFQSHLRELRQAAEEVFRQDQADATTLWSKLQRGELPRHRSSWFSRLGAPTSDPEELLLDYCRLRLRSMIHKHLVALLQEVSAKVTGLHDRLIKLKQSLMWLADEFAAALDGRQSGPPEETVAEVEHLAEPDYVEQLDRLLRQQWLDPQGGLLTFADQGPDGWRALRKELHQRARQRVLASMHGIDAGYLLCRANPTAERLKSALAAGAEQAIPLLRPQDGRDRLFVIVSQGAASAAVADAVRQNLPEAALVPSSEEGDLVFLCEAARIALADAAAAIIGDRGDCAAAALRVLTRQDVPWMSLASAGAPT